MQDDKLVRKLVGQRLIKHILRYNSFLNFDAPEVIQSSELRMILELLCKNIDATAAKQYGSDSKYGHKDFIDEDIVKEYSSFFDEYFKDADENDLLKTPVFDFMGYNVYNLDKFLILEKEDEEGIQDDETDIVDLEHYKLNKIIEEELINMGLK